MKVIEYLISDKPTLSFEVFPPKKEDTFASVKQATEEIASLKPPYMSVTYGAGGGTSRYTVEIASNIQKHSSVDAIAHLTCVSTSREGIKDQLEKMKAQGIENILALRGDIPQDAAPREEWSFQHASDLVKFIKENGDFCIGGACYPEGHPESKNIDADIKGLKKKVDAGVDYLTTQMFFDNDLFFRYLVLLHKAGIDVPVVPGIMPITKTVQLKRAIELSGSYVPKRFIQLVDRYGDNEAAMRQAGIIYATDQIIELYASGVNHVHLYTMNDYGVAQAIQSNISAILGL